MVKKCILRWWGYWKTGKQVEKQRPPIYTVIVSQVFKGYVFELHIFSTT